MCSYQLMFPGVRSSLVFSQDLELSLLPLVFSLILTVASRLLHLLSKTMGCPSGCPMSSASIQKFVCGICSAFKCSFDEFVGEKVVSPSYSSAILVPPTYYLKLQYIDSFILKEKLGGVAQRWQRNERETTFSPTNSSKDYLNAEQLPQNNF